MQLRKLTRSNSLFKTLREKSRVTSSRFGKDQDWKLNHNLKNRTRNLKSAQKLLQTESELSLERELVQEIRLTNNVQPSSHEWSIKSRNCYIRQISNKKKIVRIQTPKIWNLEEKLGKIKRVKPKLIQNSSQLNKAVSSSYCSNLSKSRSRSRQRIVSSQHDKCNKVFRSRDKRNSDNSLQQSSIKSNRSLKNSKPSSVTTFYTASSANGSHAQVRVLSKCEDSFQYQRDNIKYLMKSREIIEEINESINSSVANNMSKLQCYQNNLQSSELDISLISEVQSEFDKNCSMSIDNKESIQW